ncbi:MAG: Lrp/AsnC family transcriptional regulator [Propionibacteriales bacterium]|nr:Lrp/AsnC family transcriptional regulator [Propionibacteriales bacterium]
MSAPVLDEVAKRIIALLQVDGRMSYAAIGKEVGLSEAAVRQRVQKLTDSGVINIVAVTDPMQLGFAREALIGVRGKGPLEPLAESLAEIPEVDYVVITAGSFDIILELVCETDEHLLQVLSENIRAREDVVSTETFTYLKLVKQTYTWGVPD